MGKRSPDLHDPDSAFLEFTLPNTQNSEQEAACCDVSINHLKPQGFMGFRADKLLGTVF